MLSEDYLANRGYCCGEECCMCPYYPKHIMDNKRLAPKYLKRKKRFNIKG